MEATRLCPYCLQPLPDGAHSCPHCGKSFAGRNPGGTLPVGTVLEIGEAAVRVTQIGKECHSDCEIRRITGQCVMPTEGIFAEVVREGRIYPGDAIVIKKECGDEVH